MTQRINCWEYRKCGREPGGAQVQALGSCPAAKEEWANNLNYGKNGGRVCWAIALTQCREKLDGIVADRYEHRCQDCEFKQLVREQEGENFVDITAVIERIDQHLAEMRNDD